VISDIAEVAAAAVVRAQVVVLGSGIAGAEVATFLARRGRRVVLVESGRERFDPAIQALNGLTFAGKAHRPLDPDAGYHRYLPPELRGVSRVRQFGGTSNVWTGKWKMLEASHLEDRPWVRHSTWPIGMAELAPHYRATAADYGFGDFEAEAARPAITALRGDLAGAGLKATSFYWEASPTRTATRFGDELRRSPNAHVILGATAVELELDASLLKVAAVRCRSLEGHELRVEGGVVVVATGSLEAARLLLASDRQIEGGIGNRRGLVGRFYSDHLKAHTGVLHPGPLLARHTGEVQYQPKPRFCVCFALDDDTQREHELLEHAVYLAPIYERSRDRARRILRRRPAVRDGNGRVAAYRVTYAAEQAPNPDSRAVLGRDLDALGQRELVLDWRLTDHDHRSTRRTVELLARRFVEVGLGTFDFAGAPPTPDAMTDAAHQMGTTRMAACPEGGVVDTDCRVFGTQNLYVASSAVFPSGPCYSPTFTILALARRLGHHLLARVPAG
jgi:choline dehydrogenase-like flavoprotein